MNKPSLWNELEPQDVQEQPDPAVDPKPAEDEQARRDDQNSESPELHIIRALQALSRRNSATGRAEANPRDAKTAQEAQATARFWGRTALEHVAAALGETIPEQGGISNRVASHWVKLLEDYGKTGPANAHKRNNYIRELEDRIRARSDN